MADAVLRVREEVRLDLLPRLDLFPQLEQLLRHKGEARAKWSERRRRRERRERRRRSGERAERYMSYYAVYYGAGGSSLRPDNCVLVS